MRFTQQKSFSLFLQIGVAFSRPDVADAVTELCESFRSSGAPVHCLQMKRYLRITDISCFLSLNPVLFLRLRSIKNWMRSDLKCLDAALIQRRDNATMQTTTTLPSLYQSSLIDKHSRFYSCNSVRNGAIAAALAPLKTAQIWFPVCGFVV